MKKQIILALFILVTALNLSAMEAPKAKANLTPEKIFWNNLLAGNLEAVKKYLDESKRNINQTFQDPSFQEGVIKARFTPLQVAAYNGHAHIVDYFIKEKKATPSTIDANGDNALASCLANKEHTNHLEIVKCLLECQSPWQQKSTLIYVGSYGLIPLFSAIRQGYVEVTDYLLSQQQDFDPIFHGVPALSLARNNTPITKLLTSKGVTPLNRDAILPFIFYHEAVNKHLNLEQFDIIAHITQPIVPNSTIKGLAQGGTLNIIQPRVQSQSAPINDACFEEKLKNAAEKLGGTKKMHQETSPLFGETCSYHTMKNALVGLLLLEDYDQLAHLYDANQSNQTDALTEIVNNDLATLTTLKTSRIDCGELLETIQSKIITLNNRPSNFERNKAIVIHQGVANDMLIAREVFDRIIREKLIQTNPQKAISLQSSISFVNAEAMSRHNSGYFSKEDHFSEIRKQELYSEIERFKNNDSYRHAFSISLSTGDFDGYGNGINPNGKSRMHAIAVIIDKKGTRVNAYIFESNNHTPWAIKQIVTDFINLFVTESAQHSAQTTTMPSNNNVSAISSLLQKYHDAEQACNKSQKREDVETALLHLSQLQHVANMLHLAKAHQQENEQTQEIEKIYNQHKLTKEELRSEEIKLHKLLQEIENKELNDRFFTAIQLKDIPTINEAIKIGINPNATDSNGNTALCVSIPHGLEVIKTLIEHQANINLPNKNGATPLMIASEYSTPEIVEYLLSKGADANAIDNEGCTPLMYSATWSNPSANKNPIALMEQLIEKGANIRAKNKAGYSLLEVCAICGSIDTFKHLIEKYNQKIELTRLIEVLTTGKFGSYGPLLSPNSFIDYITQTYDISQKDNQQLLLNLAIAAIKKQNMHAVKYILEKRLINIDAQDPQGQTLLMHAALTRCIYSIKYLIGEAHASINIPDKQGKTAKDILIQSGNLQLFAYFIQSQNLSANETDSNRMTFLHHLAQQGNQYISDFIEQHKPNVNVADNQGRTPLMIIAGTHGPSITCKAKECSHQENDDAGLGFSFGIFHTQTHAQIAKILIQNGANLDTKDLSGKTALDYAQAAGRIEVVNYLTTRKTSSD